MDLMARVLIENSVDLIVRGDANRNRIFVSPSSREILGYEPSDLMGGHAYELVHPDDAAQVSAKFQQVGPDNPCQSIVFRMRRRDGDYIWVEGRYRHLPQDGGILAMLRDITAQKRAEIMLADAMNQLELSNRMLINLASRDGLTGIANRRCFDEMLDEEFRRSCRQDLPLAVILFDVDYFKSYNDCYGHLAGDKCLIRIANAVATALNRPGDLAARFGGEEIVVLLPATDLDGAVVIAQQIRETIAGLAIVHGGNKLGIVTISGGVCATSLPHFGDTPASLLHAADQALYQAKADGRNCVRAGAASDAARNEHLLPIEYGA
jgi:diguanylate cyclase (GGDEF)-like protein/PAS domain S-box-containing protein